MGGTYDILEKLPGGTLLLVERAESLERAKMRFFALNSSSLHEYVVYVQTRQRLLNLKVMAGQARAQSHTKFTGDSSNLMAFVTTLSGPSWV